MRLNPFLIREVFLTISEIGVLQALISLNPFLIREVFLTAYRATYARTTRS